MKTNIENKKSIEQEALRSYAWKIAYNKMNKISRNLAFISAGLTILTFCIYNAQSPLWLQLWVDFTGGILAIFCLFVIGFFSGSVVYIFFTFISSIYYLNDSYIAKIISLLSDETQKKRIKDYIDEKIISCEENILYCQKKVDYYQRSIDHSTDEIDRLKTELENM